MKTNLKLISGLITAGCIATSAVWAKDAPAEDATATEAAKVAAPAAEIANNAIFGDWVVTCEAITVSRNACRLVQEHTLRESGEMVARFIAVPVVDGVILLAQVPMGVYLPGGAVYRFEDAGDEEEQREMIWQRCADTVCEAAAPINEDELKLFSENKALLFGFRMSAQSDPVILRVDLEEFSGAVDQIRATLK